MRCQIIVQPATMTKLFGRCVKLLYEMCGGYADRRIDDSEIFKGAPVGLQVMCRRLQEEKVLDLVECITSALARFRP
jgi:hypothetical protein